MTETFLVTKSVGERYILNTEFNYDQLLCSCLYILLCRFSLCLLILQSKYITFKASLRKNYVLWFLHTVVKLINIIL